MRVELIPYPNAEELNRALMEKEVHATCVPQLSTEPQTPPYHTITRLQRLYEIMETELASPATVLSYINLSESGEKH